jgi:hypothetical protein
MTSYSTAIMAPTKFVLPDLVSHCTFAIHTSRHRKQVCNLPSVLVCLRLNLSRSPPKPKSGSSRVTTCKAKFATSSTRSNVEPSQRCATRMPAAPSCASATIF